MDQKEQEQKMKKVIARAWTDDGFKRKLLSDATATLKAEGIAIPAGATVRVVENTDKVFHVVLPAKPTGELADADLEKVAGGFPGIPEDQT